ncbi:hypothetical protein IFR05_003011 [Cadophora sp. M221]|nr:hypothetical protein IFR05_003011 [Cadophora sp. M221]
MSTADGTQTGLSPAAAGNMREKLVHALIDLNDSRIQRLAQEADEAAASRAASQAATRAQFDQMMQSDPESREHWLMDLTDDGEDKANFDGGNGAENDEPATEPDDVTMNDVNFDDEKDNGSKDCDEPTSTPDNTDAAPACEPATSESDAAGN